METKRVYAKGDLYMGIGHAPHPTGTGFELPAHQAAQWVEDGLVTFEHPHAVKRDVPEAEAAAVDHGDAEKPAVEHTEAA